MTTWNYRLIRHNEIFGMVVEECVGIYEVYYDDLGNVKAYSQSPCGFVSESVDGLRETLDMVAEAFKKPVLDAKDLPPA